MRVLMVVASMTTGGIQSTVRDLANELVAQGHEVGIASLCLQDEVVTRPEVRRWSRGLPGLGQANLVRAVQWLRGISAGFSPDVLHTHAIHSNIVGSAVSRVARLPHVATVHSVREGGRSHAGLWRAVRSSRTDITAVSGAVVRAHALPSTTPVVHNGVDIARFAFSEGARVDGRAELGISPGQTLLLSVGRLTDAKDFPGLIDAVGHLLAEGTPGWRAADPEQVVVVAGGGSLREGLVDQARSAGVDQIVRFIGPRDDVPRLLSAADVYVQSSAWEGFPVAPLEAMAAGLPVVATDVGGTSELSPAPQVLVEPGNPKALAAGLRQAHALVRSAQDRHLAGEMDHYAMDTWVRTWLQCYRKASER